MAVVGGNKDFTADVFDFFDTPRNDDTVIEERTTSGKQSSKNIYSKKDGAFHARTTSKTMVSPPRRSRKHSSSDSDTQSSDSDSSDIETESVSSDKQTNKVTTNGRAFTPADEVQVKGETYSDDSFTDESSSAYSDGSSDEEDVIETEREKFRQKNDLKERRFDRPSDLQVHHKPPVQQRKDSSSPPREAWSTTGIQKVEIHPPPKKYDDDDDDDDVGYEKNVRIQAKNFRPKSSKLRSRNGQILTQEKLDRSKSGSESEMTDVSPLPSPRNSPRTRDKQNENSRNEKSSVQYPGFDEPEIKLDNDKIDLSVLMDAVNEIERERERAERLRVNSRRVMFAPPKAKGKPEGVNYSYDRDRTKMIEKENQRLLREIMKHVGPANKRKTYRTENLVHRLTPSAVNRQREQRRIESDNLAMLKRLQTARSSKGMSRDEQLTDYKRTVLFGVPIAAVHDPVYNDNMSTLGSKTRSLTSVFSGGTASNAGTSRSRRSRPCSAKSNASSVRPGSAKSVRSVASSARPGSAKSSVRSVRSIRSMHSALQSDHRPPWDDRFAFS